MKSRMLITFAVLVSILVLSSIQLSVSYAPRLYRSFRIEVPTEVVASPGDMVTINGSIYNTGLWWLHDFNLTLSGLSYEHFVVPSHFDNLRILRGWDSDRGVYIMPETFLLTIKVPEDATGASFVTITGQEFQSWKQVSNTTTFVLKITSAPTKFSITDLVIPENVTEFQPFDISFTVNNEGSAKGTVTIATNASEDWTISEKVKTLNLDANSSSKVVLTITPTNSSGIISISAEYPYNQTIIHITKVGNLLIPMPKSATTTTQPTKPILPSKIILPYFNTAIPLNKITLLIAIIIIVVLVILWKVLSMYQFKIKRGKPEEMKKQAEPAEHVESNSEAESFSNSTTQI
jgi:hypothetical protein